jgi:hypothetical protein
MSANASAATANAATANAATANAATANAATANAATANAANANAIFELFDWIASKKHIRGSRRGDGGLWVHSGATPRSFCSKTRIVVLDDGVRYLLRKETSCKALGMDKTSEALLLAMPGNCA